MATGTNDNPTTPSNISSMWSRATGNPPSNHPSTVTPAPQAIAPITEYIRQ